MNSTSTAGFKYVQFTWADKFILLGAVAIVATLYGVLWQSGIYGNQFLVYVGEKYWGSVDPYSNQTLEIKGPLGISRLEVSAGRIRFVESPCTTKQCIHQGWLQHAGEFAACLPNRISVRVQGPDPRYDTLNF